MKLISWNIQWCRGCDGRVDPARIARVARDMADFDVLCLQEVASNYPDLAGSSGEDQFEALAGLFPRHTVVKGVAVDVLASQGERREFGNAIVTRLLEMQIEASGHTTAPTPEKKGGPFQPVPRPASGILTADFNFPPEDAL